jgi:hypothetical protein
MRAGTVGALVLAAFCAYTSASEPAKSASSVTTKVVSRGRAPLGGFGYWYMRAATFAGSKAQMLAVPMKDAIRFLRMRGDTLTREFCIRLDDTTYGFEISPGSVMQKRRAFWTCGDINDDGSDEVIVALDTLVLLYSLVGSKFVPETATLPTAVRQIVAGDIDNDGRSELIACCDTTTNGRWREGYPGMRYCIYVCKLVSKKLDILWTDHAKLGYGEPIMPDYFWSIADFQNLGRNQLLVARAQSDVSATVYDLLEWSGSDSGLSRQASFLLSDTIVPASSRVWDVHPYAIGRMLPLRTDLGTLVMVEVGDTGTSSAGDWGTVFRQRLLRFIGGAVRSFGDVWYRDYPYCSNFYGTFDPDGRGAGIVYIWLTDPLNCYYQFRRVLVNQQQPQKVR